MQQIIFYTIFSGISTSVSVKPMGITFERELPRNISIEKYQLKCENLTLKINNNKHVRHLFRECTNFYNVFVAVKHIPNT